jgi:hypothetical protein
MPDRNSIIEKIRALLSKTVENGCTEAEMMAALERAAAMQDAYDISDEELQLTKEEKVMLHADPPDLSDPHKIKWQLCGASATFESTAHLIRPDCSASVSRAMCSSPCGYSIPSPTSYSPSCMRI